MTAAGLIKKLQKCNPRAKVSVRDTEGFHGKVVMVIADSKSACIESVDVPAHYVLDDWEEV